MSQPYDPGMTKQSSANRGDQRDQKRRAASALGAAAVKRAIDGVLIRRRYAERVGIHATTLRRWESAGVVSPTRTEILGIPTLVYTDDDVEIGRQSCNCSPTTRA